MSLSGWSSSNYLGGASNQTDPSGSFSLFCWLKATTTYNNGGNGVNVFGWLDGSVGPYSGRISQQSTVSAGTAFAQPSATPCSSALSTMAVGTWYALLAVFQTSSPFMRIYVNAVAGTDDTTHSQPTNNGTNAHFDIGRDASNNVLANWLIEGCAHWNMALSQSDATNLLTLPPSSVQAANLQKYYILNANSNITDQQGNYNMTLTGSLTFSSDEPPPFVGGGKLLLFQE